MGCAFTKSGDENGSEGNSSKKGARGAQKGGDLESPPEPPAADPRLPLNVRQKFSITKSWKGIARAMEPTGVNMFVK